MNPNFKIFFKQDGVIKSALIKSPAMVTVFRDVLSKPEYENWIMVKEIYMNRFWWRDGIVNSNVVIRELAMQQCVEDQLFDKLDIKTHPFTPLN